MNPDSSAKRMRWLKWAAALGIVAGLAVLARVTPTGELLQNVQDWIRGLGFWGPAALVVIYVVAALVFFPAWILTVAAGAIYGLALGTVIVSIGSTTGAALAFLIARYGARERVRRRIERSPKLAAVDRAIGERGWKIVALLRLSPAIPFALQNYLYGVTAIRFWPYVLTSWATMLPATFAYIYLGSLGAAAAQREEAGPIEWTIRIVGLLATVAVTAYITHLARRAIQEKTAIEEAPSAADGP